MSEERNLIRKFTDGSAKNEASMEEYYVCHTPFRVGMGAWSWRVKVNDVYKIDGNEKWWFFNREADKFVPVYAYNGANVQFNLKYYGTTMDQNEFMAGFRQNCKRYVGSAVNKVLDQIRQENEFTGTKAEILKYLESQDESTKFLIRKV